LVHVVDLLIKVASLLNKEVECTEFSKAFLECDYFSDCNKFVELFVRPA